MNKESGSEFEMERMKRKYSLLQTEFEAQDKELLKSRVFTWVWFVAALVFSAWTYALHMILTD